MRQRNCNPNMYIMMLLKLSFPTSQQINHSSRHDLLNPEKTQNHSPQVSRNITTKKQVIHIFSTFLTHAIPIHIYYSTLLLIVCLIYSSILSVSNQHNPLILSRNSMMGIIFGTCSSLQICITALHKIIE